MDAKKTGNHYLQYHINAQEAGREVRSFLYQELKLTTSKIRSVKWDPAGILLDGERVTVRARVKEGQVLSVLLNDSLERADKLISVEMPLQILYEDENLLFVNKSAGMVSHPSQGHPADSLANGVRGYFDRKGERSSVHLIGRLDKDTSGILCIAKNGVTADRMTAQRKNGTMQKEYLALVTGNLPEPEGYIDTPMEEYCDPEDGNKLKMRAATRQAAGAKVAGTHYRMLREFPGGTLCALTLDTGRTHQIRFHMASIGCPLLGDPLYGAGSSGQIARTALHAGTLTAIHPFDGRKLCLKAELPEDMRHLLEYSQGKRT